DVAHQGCAREAWSTDRIARANGELVAPVTLVVSGRTEELVARIEMQAQALDGLRDDALGLDAEAMRVHAGRRVDTELHRERWHRDRFLVEVIEPAESEVAGLRPIVDFAGVRGEESTDADLKVWQRAIQQLDREEATVGAPSLECEPC